MRIVTNLLETPRRCSMRRRVIPFWQIKAVADLVELASGNFVVPLKRTGLIAWLCVELAQSERK